MSETSPFFPPPEPLPQGPLPQATPPASSEPESKDTPPANRRIWPVVLGTVAAICLFLGILGVVGVLLVGLLVRIPPTPITGASPDGGPVSGEPGSPVASDPIECPDACFTAEAAAGATPTQGDFETLGVTVLSPRSYRFSLGQQYASDAQAWQADGGSPDNCFPLYSVAPMSTPLGSPPSPSADTIDYASMHSSLDNHSQMSQTVRIFSTSRAATDHLTALAHIVAGCSDYRLSSGTSSLASIVRSAAALELPGSIAAVGWVEDTVQGHFYVFDLQLSNMVVRSYLVTDGSVTEASFRAVMTHLAAQISQLDPTATVSFAAPTGCTGTCLTFDQARTLTPTPSSLGLLGGLVPDPGNAALSPTLMGAEWDAASATYVAGHGDPFPCFFTLSTSPISSYTQQNEERKDPAIPLGTYSRAETTLTETAHVYSVGLYSGRYLSPLTSQIKQCAHFTYTVGGGVRSVEVTPAKFATVSSEVESVAWVENTAGSTKTVIDLRYRNVTIRIAIDQTGGTALSHDEIAKYVRDVSTRLLALG
ncbi:hypothetical protein BH11ACT4_BH11ACT4_13760 [soil metagenome]